MSKVIERDEFISVINTPIEDYEDSISDSYFYVLMYRLVSRYGNVNGLQVRTKFERILDCDLLRDVGEDTDLKQRLWDYGICFGEDTMTNIHDSDEKRLLVVLHEWKDLNDLTQVIDERRSSGMYEVTPTDLFVETLNTNSEYDRIVEVLNNSPFADLTMWFLRKDYNYYADFAERDEVFSKIFTTDEIYDIRDDMNRIIDVPTITKDTVDSLIQLGHQLYIDGFKCLEFNNMHPELRNVTEHAYFTMVTSFLVFMSETYNMSINTTCDEIFCIQYSRYRDCSFCLAEDLLSHRYDYMPIMNYVTRSDNRFLYIRRIESKYTYYYFREDEMERLITGDTGVKIHKWSPQNTSTLRARGIITTQSRIDVSEFLDELNADDDDKAESKDPVVIPLFSYIESEDRLKEIVRAINLYNARYHESVVTKYVTVRDLVCRRAKDGDSEYIEIGYIQASELDSYDYRLAENLTVSSINEQEREMISRSYFTIPRNLNRSLYGLRYTYDLFINSPKRFLDLVEDTGSVITDVISPISEEDEKAGNIRTFSPTEKFLYYVVSSYMPIASYRNLEDSLQGENLEYKAALYRGVFTITEVMPEMIKYFTLPDLIEADLLDAYGNINSEYIKSDNNGTYFNIKNKLFGVMKIDK